VHHVSLGTVSAPPMLWRLPIPFVWGPLGGGQTAPSAFRSYFGADWRRETVRSLRVRLISRLPALRRAVQRSALLLATNRETANVLQEAGAPRVQLFIDNGIATGHLPAIVPQRSGQKSLTLLWAGRLEPRKALALALEAVAHVGHLPVRLIVAGEGPLRSECEKLSERMGLQDRVEFLGLVPWEKMPEVFRRADALLFTSLQDSFGSVVLEAMAHALPILTLDHQGVGAFVPMDAGIKVPIKGVKETVAGLADGIRRLASSPEARWRMGTAGRTFASTQTWERRAERMSELYEESLRSRRCN
jgi:glycosyltransferase involved in cell wall biosynthesis